MCRWLPSSKQQAVAAAAAGAAAAAWRRTWARASSCGGTLSPRTMVRRCDMVTHYPAVERPDATLLARNAEHAAAASGA